MPRLRERSSAFLHISTKFQLTFPWPSRAVLALGSMDAMSGIDDSSSHIWSCTSLQRHLAHFSSFALVALERLSSILHTNLHNVTQTLFMREKFLPILIRRAAGLRERSRAGSLPGRC